MGRLAASVPRAANFVEFGADPLDFLARARAELGDLFALRDDGPVFSRAANCAGVVAAFGAAHQRAVLGDIDVFGMPMSAALQLTLPPKLINLTRGLHSMRGEEHAAQRHLVRSILSEGVADHHGAVHAALEAFTGDWRTGAEIGLLESMRGLAMQVSVRVLFGAGHADRAELGSLLQAYFHLRREVSAPAGPAGPAGREALVALGTSLDDSLRTHVRRCRQGGRDPEGGIFARLASARAESGMALDEDAVIAHSNVLFVSSTEPIAIALTWILLVLSQLPDLRGEIRRELDGAGGPRRVTLLDRVIDECLRLLPPNALMVRITTRATRLGGVSLPARCEVVLCPFLVHRDPERFPQPDRFLPARWHTTRPSQFEYFPFGAGGHSCAGRGLANYLLETALAFLLQRYDLVLAGDQEIDWRIHIQFMPRTDPTLIIRPPGAASAREAGRLLGPVARLLSLQECARSSA